MPEFPATPFGAPERPPFAEPWQAQAFALAVQLHAQGAFTWPEWSQALGAALAAGGDDADYYDCWVAALERLASERGLASAGVLGDRKQAWADAYRRTPHGKPVEL
ncbi:MAG: nitrile hydratase accessory protein [Caulobacteraceae bacterium]|nr:nitrile hydratase accessory protein [Caulobacteraceae bacterium]